MKRDIITYKGVKYPVIEIARNLIDSEWKNTDSSLSYTIADNELWSAIEKDYEDNNSMAIEIDNLIFYFFYNGFVASEPTEEEVIKYFEEVM